MNGKLWSINCFVSSVLPSFSIIVEPEANYISYGNFDRFNFKVSARWTNMLPSYSGGSEMISLWIKHSVCFSQVSSRGSGGWWWGVSALWLRERKKSSSYHPQFCFQRESKKHCHGYTTTLLINISDNSSQIFKTTASFFTLNTDVNTLYTLFNLKINT